MRTDSKIRKMIAICIMSVALLTANSSKAFVWPGVSPSNIASFISSISSGIGEIQSAKAQIDNITETIHSIGDQVSAIAKYATDLKKAIASIAQSVSKICESITRSAKDVSSIMSHVKEQMQAAAQTKQDTSEVIVQTVNENIDNEDEENIREMLKDGEEECKAKDKEVKETLDKAEKTINNLINQSKETLDSLLNTIATDEDLSDEDKKELQDQVDDLKEKLDELQQDAQALLDEMKKNYNENSQKVLDAYAAYNQAISDYYAGKITKEELEAQGEIFKETVASANQDIDERALNKLVSKVETFSTAVNSLQENIMNKIANSKDYSDEDEEKTSARTVPKAVNYAFNFHQEHVSTYLDGCFASNSNNCGLHNLSNATPIFLMSKQLTATQNSECKGLSLNGIEDESKLNTFIDKFRDCVVRAKTEKEYFCQDASNEEELAACKDPYEQEANFSQFKKDGVYMQIWRDYNSANIINANQLKQWSRTWLDTYAKDESTLYNLNDQLQNVDSERGGSAILTMIDLQSLGLWSKVRRVDSINRAKDVVDAFRQTKNLYLDGRDDDFKAAQDQKPGKIDVDTANGNKKTNVISNAILYACDKGGEDFSVSYEDRADANAIEEAEQNIVDCLKKYAEGATKGTIGGTSENIWNEAEQKVIIEDPEGTKRKWTENETRAITDSLFDELVLATVNNYKSSKDYATLPSSEMNVASLDKKVKQATTARDDHSAGAQINYYGTQQLLSIIDADAQHLQSEIMRDLRNISFDFFPDQPDSGDQQ